MLKRLSRVLITSLLVLSMTACAGKKTVIGEDAHILYDGIRVIDINLTDEAYGIGVDKDQPELREKINTFIKEYEKNGKFQEICSHYAGGKPFPVYSAKKDSSADQLIVASTGDFQPFDYNDGDTYYGIDKEYVSALATYLGKELVLENMNFDIMFMAVAQHKADICIAGITINEAREKYVDFSDPYYHAGQIIVTKDDNELFKNVSSLDEIETILSDEKNNIKVAVENMTIGEYYCKGNAEFGFKGFPVATVAFANLEECLEELEEGNVDIVIGDSAVLKYILENK